MKEHDIKILKKQIEFESSGEKVYITVCLNGVSKGDLVIDFLDTMFKEIKETILTLEY